MNARPASDSDRIVDQLRAEIRRAPPTGGWVSSPDLSVRHECERLAIEDPATGFDILLTIVDQGLVEELEDRIAYTFWDELLSHGLTPELQAFLAAVRSRDARRAELAPLAEYLAGMTGIHPEVRQQVAASVT